MRCQEKNTVNKIEENEPQKLKNKLLVTGYAKIEKKKKNGGNHKQTMTATHFRYLNEQGYKFFMITTEISSHVRYLLEEKGPQKTRRAKASIKTSMRWSVFSTSVANETVNLNIWFELNQWAKIP